MQQIDESLTIPCFVFKDNKVDSRHKMFDEIVRFQVSVREMNPRKASMYAVKNTEVYWKKCHKILIK
jgi:hypothetical protein